MQPHHPSPEEYRTIAHGDYSSDDIEIDPDAAISYADNGAWVQAWVWVYAPEPEENE